MAKYLPPRMLTATLVRLRKRRPRKTIGRAPPLEEGHTKLTNRTALSQEMLAAVFGVTQQRIAQIEVRDASITYADLHKYSLFFACPPSIIAAVSHVAAMTRDAICHPVEDQKARERVRLKVLATYLRNMSDYVLDPRYIEHAAEKHPYLNYDKPETWDKLLDELMTVAQRNVPATDCYVFEDRERLSKIVNDTLEQAG